MPRKVVLDDACKDITKTRVWKVLNTYHDKYDGVGLTANALCYLTNQPWKIVKFVLTKHTGEAQITGSYCYDVNAPVFSASGYITPGQNYLMANQSRLVVRASDIIRRYPPSKYQGATNDKGQKTLTFFQVENAVDTEDYYDRCDDPECCPPRTEYEKAKLATNQAKRNRKISDSLKRAWKR